MKRLLICTIARDAARTIHRWSDLITQLGYRLDGHYEVALSVVENDSVDGTDRALRDLRREWDTSSSPFARAWLSVEKLGTQRYPSVWSLDRLRNLAAARQRCLDQVHQSGVKLGVFDKIAYIEPDVTYDPKWAAELVLARHPIAAGVGEPDVYSGWSLRSEAHPKESTFLYDVCATRATERDTCWDVTEECGRWRSKSLVPTNLGGIDGNCLHQVWSTFNCLCVYNARPFMEGLRWGYVNRRLNTGQQYVDGGDHGSGWLDADTAVTCEGFRARGYQGVYVNTNCLIRHS